MSRWPKYDLISDKEDMKVRLYLNSNSAILYYTILAKYLPSLCLSFLTYNMGILGSTSVHLITPLCIS